MKVTALIAATIALATCTQSALAATTFTAKVDPVEPGTQSEPKPVDIDLSLELESDAVGTPVGVARLVDFALPSEFVNQLARFDTCSRQTLATKEPSECPAGAILGSAVMVGAPTLLPGRQETLDRGVLVNLGGDKIVYWWKITQPVTIQGIFDGVVSAGSDPFGPVATFDFSPLADGSAANGLEIRLKRLDMRFRRLPAGSADEPKKPKRSCRSKAKEIRNAKRRTRAIRRCRRNRKRASCRVKGRNIKNAMRRRRAFRRCVKAGPSGRRQPRRAGPAQASQAEPERAPFASAGCASGTWPFQARITYEDDRREQADAGVSCSKAVTPTPCLPLLPCPPSQNRAQRLASANAESARRLR